MIVSLRNAINSTTVLVVIALIPAIIAGSTLTSLSPMLVFAQVNEKLSAKLSGSNEVPSKNTKGNGTVEFSLSCDQKTMRYTVDVQNMDKLTMAYIRQGNKVEIGPVVAILYKGATPTWIKNGALMQGSITASQLEDPLKGKQISDLVNIIKSGDAYGANVYPEQNSKEEIIGQIFK
jgi:hypothetical protein